MFASFLLSAFATVGSAFRTRAALQIEILALRHQLTGPAEIPTRPGATDFRRPAVLGGTLPFLVAMAHGAADRETRNGDRLASTRIPLVLAVEESAGRTRKAYDRLGSAGVDPPDEPGKSPVGRIASG